MLMRLTSSQFPGLHILSTPMRHWAWCPEQEAEEAGKIQAASRVLAVPEPFGGHWRGSTAP